MRDAGFAYYQRWTIRGQTPDRDAAIAYLETAVAEAGLTLTLGKMPLEEPASIIADALGQLLYSRYTDPPDGAAANPGDLDRAIDLLLAAATADPHPLTVVVLMGALSDRVDLLEAPGDLDLLILWGQRLLTVCDPLDGEYNDARLLLGVALMERASANLPTSSGDLDAAISCLETALTTASPGDPEWAPLLANVAHACWRRLDGDGSWPDLVDKMARYAWQAWELSPADDEDRMLIGLYAATGILEQLTRPDAPIDIEPVSRAIDILTGIEPLMAGEPDLHLSAVVMLGCFLVQRGQLTGAVTDLKAAVPLVQRGVAEIDPDDPSWSQITQILAGTIGVLAYLGMEIDHLDQAISLLTAAARWPYREPARTALVRGVVGGLLIQRATFRANLDDLDKGIAQLLAAHEMVPAGHPYRLATAANLAGGLLARFMERGQVEDVDAARYYLTMASSLSETARDHLHSLMTDTGPVIALNLGMLAAIEGVLGDAHAYDRAVDSFRAALAQLPPGHPHASRIRSDLGLALALRAASVSSRPDDAAEAIRELNASATATTGTHLMRPMTLLRAGSALAAAAETAGDERLLRQSIDYLSAALSELDPRFGSRFRFLVMLGTIALMLHRYSGDARNLDHAVDWLEQAHGALDDRPYHPQSANCLIQLARAYRARGDTEAAHEAGLLTLRGRARELLLQSGTVRSIRFARLAAAEAAEVAGWCFADGRMAGAVETLELGRGLILHASTCVTGFADLLMASGHEDLAREWREATVASGDPPWDTGVSGAASLPGLLSGESLDVPDALRARAMSAVAGTDDELRLLAPPSPADLAAALANTGTDALIYLLGPVDGRPGRAIIVTAACGNEAAEPAEIPLPWISRAADDVLEDYLSALAASGQDRENASADRWPHALEAVCEWAWHVVMRPVLAATHGWKLDRPPRLVFVTAGTMSLVPWHAARYRPDQTSPYRYVLEDIVISYTASGRQLREVAGRSPLPLASRPVVVGDPTSELPWAQREAQAILRCHYPAGRYLGKPAASGWGLPADGPGTAAEVLEELPGADRTGASVLHLGCHGMVVGSAPGASHLQLAAGEQLRVDTILRQASGRPADAPGGLVSLAACSSDLATADYDEALTPATAFLAAGAVTVVGARWPVRDNVTTLLMFMFHYFMTHHGCSPRDALRSAQRWMLNPTRVAPPEMPPELANHAHRRILGHVTAWAGFVHQGR